MNPIQLLVHNVKAVQDYARHLIQNAESENDLRRAADLLHMLAGAGEEMIEGAASLLEDIGRTTVDEPMPTTTVEDFEASVLRTIASL